MSRSVEPTPDRPEWTPLQGAPLDLAGRVCRTATEHPDRVFLLTSNGDELTYRELLDRARRLAEVFADHAGPGGVTVLTADDRFVAIAIVAAAIAGRPLGLVDGDDPPARANPLLRTIANPVVTDDGALLSRFDIDGPTRVVDATGGDPTAGPNADPVGGDVSGEPVLLLSTSGSTADPKIGRLSAPRWRYGQIESAVERAVTSGSVGTYAYINPVSAALYFGGSVAAFRADDDSATSYVAFVRRVGATKLSMTPTLMRAMHRVVGGGIVSDAVRQINLRGERVTADDVVMARALVPNAVVQHLYASTEAGHIAGVSVAPGDPVPDDPTAFTELAEGVDVRVVGPDGAPCVATPGVEGELLVDGPAIFDGYVGRPSDDVLVEFDGKRWVRTGDSVLFEADARFRVVGRLGRRVKVSGLFVDLDLVAAAFEEHPDVAQAAVTWFEHDDVTRLVGHLVPAPGRSPDPVAIRAGLGARLPVHMVPSLVRVVDDPPRNAAGKIDHLALERWRPAATTAERGEVVREAATPVESMVAATAAELLGRPVTLDDDLISAGFSSVDWIELIERIDGTTGCHLELVPLFARPTPRGIADRVDGGRTEVPVFELAAGRREPAVFWCMTGVAAQEAMPLARSLDDRSCFVPMPRGLVRPGRVAWRPDAAVDEMVSSIDESGLGDGRAMVVVGFSTGCHFARGVAAALRARGTDVPLLVLLDPLPTRRGPIGALRREVRYAIDRTNLALGRLGEHDRQRAIFRSQVRNVARARPAAYGGAVLLVRSTQWRGLPVPDGLTGPVDVEVVPGTHHDVIVDGDALARMIERHLDRHA